MKKISSRIACLASIHCHILQLDGMGSFSEERPLKHRWLRSLPTNDSRQIPACFGRGFRSSSFRFKNKPGGYISWNRQRTCADSA